ncbi:MAG: hypothetical protein E7376_03370 [Clostridiales bacterium]|nr:hypothetical protein [Clostridiales bacterium]
MRTNKSNKKLIMLYMLLPLTFAIVIAVVFFIITDINKRIKENTPIVPPTNIVTPTLTVPNSITIDKLETFKFEYTVENLGNFIVSLKVENSNIASINKDGYIIPNSVGTTNLITEINCSPKITKTTTLIILDAVTDISYNIKNIDNTLADILYVNNNYILEIDENASVNNCPTIIYDDEFVSNVNKLDSTSNTLKYQFTILNPGEFVFKYTSKYVSKTINLCAYVYPNTFEVEFLNISFNNNVGNLYLFDSNYTNEANLDGFFNNCSFSLTTIENSNENITIAIDGDCVNVNNNTITAIKEGSALITFTSQISKISKSFQINVIECTPNKIRYNNNEYNFGTTINVNYEINTEYDFIIEYLPIYSLSNFILETSGSAIIVDNNSVKITGNSGCVYLKINNEIVFTLNISKLPSYKISVTLNQSESETTFQDNIFTIVYVTDCYFSLLCEIYNTDTNTKHSEQNLIAQIDNTNIVCASSGSLEVKNGILSLKANSTGTTTLILSNEELNINLTITIIVI